MAEHKDHGVTSFDRIDVDALTDLLPVQPGWAAADLGCGPGDYSLLLAELVGPDGRVVALDRWAEGVDRVNRRAAEAGLTNLTALVVDLTEPLPMEAASCDLVLLSTVTHGLAAAGETGVVLAEIGRILKPGRTLAVIEFTPGAGRSGPPEKIRLSPEEISALAAPYGLTETKRADLAVNMYLMLLQRN